MRSAVLRQLIVVGAILALPVGAYAQGEAGVNGTITDSTGGVLPGATVTASNDATGNTFAAVTDERGGFRIPLRIGTYKLAVELAGFATVSRGFEVLVGQQVTVNLQMSTAGVQESVSVTADVPLIQLTQSTLAGNVDSRQMQDLPVNGGNWQDLAVLAAGNRANDVSNAPTARQAYDFQLNMDGQQVTNNGRAGGLNPRYSREAIAEFQFVASRWDSSQGRSNGVLVNAVTKSGTNALTGSVAGYFRSDRFNAPDLVLHRVLPYSDQQGNGTFGGPIVKDKVHFFVFYERERTANTQSYTSPYPLFNIDQPGTVTEYNGGFRLDNQVGSRTHLMLRGNGWTNFTPNTVQGSAILHPSVQGQGRAHSDQLFASFTKVLSNRALNEVKAGYAGVTERNRSVVNWPQHPQAANGVEYGTPRMNFSGYSIGQNNTNWPQTLGQQAISIRDDFTTSFDKLGRHDLKVGGEYISVFYYLFNCRPCGGIYDAANSVPPANIQTLIPLWNDVTTWNLNALNPFIRTYQIGIGDFGGQVPRRTSAEWIQDDWKISQKLTLNLGLRYDLETQTWANFIAVPPILKAGRPNDKNNYGERLGFAWSLDDRTVIRGGAGKYFGQVIDNISSFTVSAGKTFVAQITNDGRPDFATNPFNGPTPTLDQLRVSRLVQSTSGGLAAPDAVIPYSWASGIGIQRQLEPAMAVTADFNFNGGRNLRYSQPNVNLTYDPATGLNYPFADLSHRPIPGWGVVQMEIMNGRANYRALETSFTKRMSHHYQLAATYNLAGLWDDMPLPYTASCAVASPTINSVCSIYQVPFQTAPDLGGVYGLATSDQRHRAVVNGIWEVRRGFQVSGLYFFGSGARFATSAGGDRRNIGATGASLLRANGTLVTRNSFVGKPLHRVDLRVSRTFALSGRVRLEGIADVFNLFNHANYGSYTTVESNAAYTQPSQNTNIAYAARTLQLGFRAMF